MRKVSRTELEDGCEKCWKYVSVMVNASHPDRIFLIFPLQTQLSRRLASHCLPHVPCFSALLMQRKKHSVMFRQSGTIKSPPLGACIFSDAPSNEFLQRVNYPMNMRETRHVSFSRKKKSAHLLRVVLGCMKWCQPWPINKCAHRASTTEQCRTESFEWTFFHFSCVHRVVLRCAP